MEKEIQKSILQYLEIKKIFCWRNNTGAYKKDNYYIRFGLKGSADIIGLLPGGRFLAIEVKASKGKVRPEQEEFLNTINHHGGLAFVARSLDDVMDKI